MRGPFDLIRVAALVAGVGLAASACSSGGEEQATAPILVAAEPADQAQATVQDGPLSPSSPFESQPPADATGQTTPTGGTGPTTGSPGGETAPTGGTPTTVPPSTEAPPTTSPTGGTDDPRTTITVGPPAPEGPVVTPGPTGPADDGGDGGDGSGDGGQQPDYDLLVFPVHAVVSPGCRDEGDFPRIFQAGNPAVVLDTFDRNPLQTSVFSEDIWVPIHGGPTEPQIELGSGQTALTTLLRATADGNDGHQVAVSVFGFVSGGIEIRWAQQTDGFGALISPRFHPLNDTTSSCWVQLNTAVVRAS